MGVLRAGPDLSELHAVLPADVDDPALVSGGNVFDRRGIDGLRALGRTVVEHLVDGAWPRPGPDARARLDRVLAGLPPGATVLADGLVVCGVPEVVVPHAGRLRLVVLVHLSLTETPAETLAETPTETPTETDLAAGERAVLTAARGVVVTSDWSARRVVARHGLDAARVAVVVPGTDPAPPTTPSEPGGRVLALGAVTPTKGQDVLVEALARARDVAPSGWHATLAGPIGRDPAFVERVRSLIDHHDLADRVTLPGPVDGAAALAGADLLVLPSRIETFGMVAAEALVRRVPVLATAVGGVTDVIRGTGTLVPPGDVSAFGAELRRWWSEPDVRRGRRLSAKFPAWRVMSWPETSRRLHRALTTLA